MTPGEYYRAMLRRQRGGPPCRPFPAFVAAGRVLYLALPPSLLRVNPGAISIPLDPAVRSEVLAPEPTAAEARWLRDQLGNLEGGPAWP